MSKESLKILCVLYDDPVDGFPPNYAREDVPKIQNYPGGQSTPTPENERRGGLLAKKGRGEPIHMQGDYEPQVGNKVELPKKTYAEVAMEKAQEEAMK